MKSIISLVFLFMATQVSADDCSDDVETLALNIYHEARGETFEGKQMVGEVTLNRVESPGHPNTICGVVYANSQFSWTFQLTDYTPTEVDAWKESVEIAESLLNGELDLFDNGATHYLNPNKVKKLPAWAEVFRVVGKVGKHVFYDENA